MSTTGLDGTSRGLGIGMLSKRTGCNIETIRYTDQTATLTAEQKARLEQALQAFEGRKGSQIAVLIVPTTQPETVEQYALRVAEQWKVGRKKLDDGTLLVVAKNDRTLRIEVGYQPVVL